MNIRVLEARRRAFSLVEMMVVIAIIGLLVAALLPAFSTVRNKAKVTQTAAIYSALDTGMRSFQAESALGGTLPPSHSDNPANRQLIANPKLRGGLGNNGVAEVTITGAHLLAQAMVGADGLFAPGFKDTGSNGGRDGRWWNDTHDNAGGIYEIDTTTFQPKFPRYGGGYVSDEIREKMRSLNDLDEVGLIANSEELLLNSAASDELMFVDPWDAPVLYYKANKAAINIVTAGNTRGIFDQEDNGLITGTFGGDGLSYNGFDFGSGAETVGGAVVFHDIAKIELAEPLPELLGGPDIQNDPRFDKTFTRFVFDPSQKARNKPFRADSYLLISAGPDSRYGTNDDIVNWTRADN